MAGGSSSDNTVQETAAQQAQASLAQARLKDYQTRWKPVENWFINQVNSPDRFRTQETGRSSAETRAQFGIAGNRMNVTDAAGGAAPGSGRFALGMTGLAADEARSTGMGMTTASQAIDDQYIKGLQDVMALGRGQQAQAFKGYETSADLSGRTALNDATLAEQSRELTGKTIGTGIGTAYGVSGGFRPSGVPGAITSLNSGWSGPSAGVPGAATGLNSGWTGVSP